MGVAILAGTKNVQFAVERFRDVYAEAQPLMTAHWEEIAKNKQLLHLNPNEKLYAQMAANLVLVTARDAGKLAGYFLWVLVNHPHCADVRTAEEDLHYLRPEYRRGLTGYLFLKFASQAAIDAGAQLLIMREKVGHEHRAVMQRLNFAPTDIVYTRAVAEI